MKVAELFKYHHFSLEITKWKRLIAWNLGGKLSIQSCLYWCIYSRYKSENPQPIHSALRETIDKISKIFNGTYAGWTSMIQGFQMYFAWNPRLKGIEGPCCAAQPIWPGSGQSRLNWLCFLARLFYIFQSRISCKTYLESLNHTCSPFSPRLNFLDLKHHLISP